MCIHSTILLQRQHLMAISLSTNNQTNPFMQFPQRCLGRGKQLPRNLLPCRLFVANIEAEGARIADNTIIPSGESAYNSHLMMASVSRIPVPRKKQLALFAHKKFRYVSEVSQGVFTTFGLISVFGTFSSFFSGSDFGSKSNESRARK